MPIQGANQLELVTDRAGDTGTRQGHADARSKDGEDLCRVDDVKVLPIPGLGGAVKRPELVGDS